MTTARSIDKAATGYARHRFVRALSASFVVGAVFLLLAVTVAAVVSAALAGEWDQVLVAPLGALLVVVLILLPIIIVVGLVGGVIDVLHRRLIGLCLCILGLLLFTLGIIAPIGVYVQFSEQPTQAALIDALTLGVFLVVAACIGFELVRHGWWQTWTPAEDYRAVRGWRPPLTRPITSFRRYLGLPSFLSYVGRKRLLASTLYFGVAAFNLGLLMLLFLPAMAGSMSAVDRSDGFNPMIVVIVMGVLLLLNLVGAGALIARLADARTTRLYQRVRDWDQRPPIIFLRAFDQDSARLRTLGGDPFARWPAGVGAKRTLDEILLEHGSPYGPVIAIGDPRDPTPPLGAARVFVPGEGAGWQDVVRGLVGGSRCVVMCPNRGEGVQWELDLIAQAGGRLQTVFLASPELDRNSTIALFQSLVPDVPAIDKEQWPLAAYQDGGAWRLLTTKRLSVDSYTTALNVALQALFGLKGVPLTKPKRA